MYLICNMTIFRKEKKYVLLFDPAQGKGIFCYCVIACFISSTLIFNMTIVLKSRLFASAKALDPDLQTKFPFDIICVIYILFRCLYVLVGKLGYLTYDPKRSQGVGVIFSHRCAYLKAWGNSERSCKI